MSTFSIKQLDPWSINRDTRADRRDVMRPVKETFAASGMHLRRFPALRPTVGTSRRKPRRSYTEPKRRPIG